MIKVYLGDITQLKVDAIVNAANSTLLGGGGVDGAIHDAAGPQLLQACRKLNGCAVGEAKITRGYQLPAKWIIHTVGPVWSAGQHNEASLLRSCYVNSFEVAKKSALRSIAFPAISTGAFHFPLQQAAEIAVNVFREYENDFEKIIACCFSTDHKRVYESLLRKV